MKTGRLMTLEVGAIRKLRLWKIKERRHCKLLLTETAGALDG